MKVLKFGTTAIANIDKINLVTEVIKQSPNSIVIFSAIAGTTNMLEEISDYLYKKNPEGANEVMNMLEIDYLNKIEKLFTSNDIKKQAITFVQDKVNYIRSFSKDLFTLFEERIVLAQGEFLSSGLFSLLLKQAGVVSKELSALDFMRTDKKSEPDTSFIQKTLQQLLKDTEQAPVYLTQGYICKNAYGEVDNFHFGGSDYTASLIGAAINAEEIQIWTDVDSMYGSCSGLISNTQIVHHINFDEAAELAYFGAKILHPMCILPAKISNIPVRLLNIFKPEEKGTLISNETESGKIKAIASKDNITAINIKSSKMLFANGFLRRICEVFEKHDTSIDMLTTSEVGISITIDNNRFLDEITNDLKKHGTVVLEANMTIISIVGDLDWTNPEIGPKILETLKNVPTRMISYGGSHNNLSLIIPKSAKETTMSLLYNSLFK